MNPEEHNDPVWKLLEQARKREASPAFVRNVVREVRSLGAETRPSVGAPGFWSFLCGSRARLGWSSAALATLVAGAFALHAVWHDPAGGVSPGLAQHPESPDDDAYAALALDLIPVAASPAVVAPSIEAFEAELNDLDYLGELLAVQDSLLLADEEIARMLY